jgi:hypothetical protein
MARPDKSTTVVPKFGASPDAHMTDEPPDPAISKAVAAYRSAGSLRTPAQVPRIVRLVEQAGRLPAPQAAQPTPGDSGRLADAAPETPPAPVGVSGAMPAKGVSLMITGAQKDNLRRLGVSEEDIRDMTPTEAHRRLGLSGHS